MARYALELFTALPFFSAQGDEEVGQNTLIVNRDNTENKEANGKPE